MRWDSDVTLSDEVRWRIGGLASRFGRVASVAQLTEAVADLAGEPFLTLGWGANLLVADRGVSRPVLVLGGELDSIRVSSGQIEAGAAAGLPALVGEARRMGAEGWCFLEAVPGSVGGGLRMNAGSADTGIWDRVIDVKAVTPKGEIVELNVTDARPAYRRVEVPEEWVFTAARFETTPGDPEAVEAEHFERRRKKVETQVYDLPSCGSVWKNPGREWGSAWELVEAVGMRGARAGGAQITEKHANFIVNLDDAKAVNVLDLMRETRRRVLEQIGVALEPEIRFWGFEEEELRVGGGSLVTRQTRRRLRVALAGSLLGITSPLWGPPILRGIPLFQVRAVEVTGTRFASDADLRQLSGIDSLASIWDDPTGWAEAIVAHPLVEEARIVRAGPNRLRIEVREVQAVALVPVPGIVAVDADGYRVDVDPAEHGLDLPILRSATIDSATDRIREEEARRSLAVLEEIELLAPEFVQRVSEILPLDSEAFDLRLMEGSPVRNLTLPYRDASRAFLQASAAIQAAQTAAGRDPVGRRPLRREGIRPYGRRPTVTAPRCLAGLDVGSETTCAVLVELSVAWGEGDVEARVLGVGEVPTSGVRNRVVTNMDAAADSIREALRLAEEMAGSEASVVYAGISGDHVEVDGSTGVVAISGGRSCREISTAFMKWRAPSWSRRIGSSCTRFRRTTWSTAFRRCRIRPAWTRRDSNPRSVS